MARILIVTDAWHPQVSGVVRTLETTVWRLRDWGHTVDVIEPSIYPSVRVPFYPEIPLSLPRPDRVAKRILGFAPEHIHISTEGPLGLLVRRLCCRMGWQFSTSYHTRFPEYLRRLAYVPESLTYRYLRWFHARSSVMMVATPSLERELDERGFGVPKRRWLRGVDQTIFYPRPKPQLSFPRPVLLYVGRVSHEKGLGDFLALSAPGTKVVVGDGPARAELQRRYPDAIFLGYRTGAALGEAYAMADLFVFPSTTDTFGIVLIEALASGLPVAAYPTTGPQDIITDSKLGALDQDLGVAITRAIATGDPASCAAHGRNYTWENCTKQFLTNMVPLKAGLTQRNENE